MGKVKAHELRNKTSKELLSDLKELRAELASLRVAKVAGGAPSKLCKIKVVRKGIARVLTVYNQKQKVEQRTKWARKKVIPKNLRPRLTKALRQKLRPEHANAKLHKTTVRTLNFPKRKFALAA